MTDNPYAPPVAIVGDMADAAALPRPRQVRWAVRLLWASTVLALPEALVDAARAPTLTHLIGGLLVEALMLAFACWLYVCVNRGRNWARIVLLLLTLLGTGVVVFAPLSRGTTTFEQVFTWLNTACDVVCMGLLFSPPASAWFRRRP